MDKKRKPLTIITGDLVGSRVSHKRRELSNKISMVIDRLLKEFRREFYAPLILTKGIDELSGVLVRPNMSYKICRLLNHGVYPSVFCFAIVRDKLDIGVDTKDARKMDGPAFHKAADMMNMAKKENLFYLFKLGFRFSDLDLWLNELSNLLYIIQSGWSKHQHNIVMLYEKIESQRKVAEELGITQQAVSDTLRQAHWKEWKRVNNKIDEALNMPAYYNG